MIARFRVLLPYKLSLAETVVLLPHKETVDGVSVVFHPPYRAKVVAEDSRALAINEMQAGLAEAENPDLTEDIKIGEQRTRFLNALQIDVVRTGEEFDRHLHTTPDEETDPTSDFLFRLANSLIFRLRSVTQSPWVQPVSKSTAYSRIDYLADDEALLKYDGKNARSIHTGHVQLSGIGISDTTWTAVHSLPVAYEPLVWETILLDAGRFLPDVGASLVLTATALETFIAYALNVLAREKQVPSDLWSWINDRDDNFKEPSVEEQFDVLLKQLSGRSLKGQHELWVAMKNIKTARNNFVHEGQARYGDQVVTQATIGLLVGRAKEIIGWVEALLPVAAQRPVMKEPVMMQLGKLLMAPGIAPMLPTPSSEAPSAV